MEVIETRDISDILNLVPIEIQIRKRHDDKSTIRDMLSYVYHKMQEDPAYHVALVHDNGGIAGYMIYDVCLIPGNKKMNIHRIWHETPAALKAINRFQDEVTKTNKLRIITMLVPWDMQKEARSWGFKRKAIVMEKEVRR